MKSIVIILLVLIGLVIGGWYYQEYIVDSEEISQLEYKQLVERGIHYGYYKYFIYETLRDDNQISKKEFKWLTKIFYIIEKNDLLPMMLQTKALERKELGHIIPKSGD